MPHLSKYEEAEMADYEFHTHEFPPLFDENSHVLILGSFPSVKSREQKFFYGHPQNRFWRLMAAITGEKVPESIDEKRNLALEHGIALYDVIESCEIRGSSDSSIRNIQPADLPSILNNYDIKNIYANGNLARDMYRKYQLPVTGRDVIGLPSSSPANAAWSFERLIERWIVIREDLKLDV